MNERFGAKTKNKFSWAKTIIVFLSFLFVVSCVGFSLSIFRDNSSHEQDNDFAPIVLQDDGFVSLKSKISYDMAGNSVLVQPVAFAVSSESSPIYVRALVKYEGSTNARQKLSYESLTASSVPVVGSTDYKWVRFGEYYYLFSNATNKPVKLTSADSGKVFSFLNKETNIVPNDIIDTDFQNGENVNLNVTLQSVNGNIEITSIEMAHSIFNSMEESLIQTTSQCSVSFYDIDGYLINSQTVGYGRSVVVPTHDAIVGENLIGWNTSSDYTGATLDNDDLSSVFEDLNLYAEFEPIVYNVTVIQPTDEYDIRVGTITPGNTTFKHGESISFKVVPNNNYYIYSVYINDENIGAVSTFVLEGYTENVTIRAEIASEKINLDINGGTGAQPKITYNEDKTKFILSEVEPIGPSGKEFYYYSTNPSDNEMGQNGVRIDLGVEYPLSYLEGLSTLYAIYLTPTTDYTTGQNYVVIPKNVTTIAGTSSNNIFASNANSVKYVTLPKTISSIGDFSFSNASNLVGISMSSVVSFIGEQAFANCSSLEEFIFTPSITEIGDGAFKNCSSLMSLINFNEIQTSELVNTFDGCIMLVGVELSDSITKLEGTFKNCSNLVDVNLPDNLKSLNDSTFENCVSISQITLPNSISNFGAKLFKNCILLSDVEGLNNVYAINLPNSMFENCISLEELVLPKNLASIGNSTFINCANLHTINNLENAKIASVGDSAFENCSSILSLKFSDTLSYVGERAFAETNITSIKLSAGLEHLGNQAFINCSNLESVTSLGTIETIGDETFKNCVALNLLNFPGTLKYLGESAIENCISLNSLEFPSSLLSISVDALKDDVNLKSITLNSDLQSNYDLESTQLNWYHNTARTSILYEKGYYTTYMPEWTYSLINGNYYVTGYNGVETNVTIPYIITDETGAVYTMTGVALRNSYSFVNVTLAEGLTEIFTFISDDITIPGFMEMSSLQSITLPSSITKISDCAFANCSHLKTIIGLENTKVTQLGTLLETNDITNINIDGVSYSTTQEKEGSVFKNCYNLSSISLPSNLQIIGINCFNYTMLQTINIPSTVIAVGALAFSECPALTEIIGFENCHLDYTCTYEGITIGAGFATLGGAAFYDLPGLVTLTLPAYANIFTISTVNYLIMDCENLTTITIPGEWPTGISLTKNTGDSEGINQYAWYYEGTEVLKTSAAGIYSIYPGNKDSDWVVDSNGMIIAYKGSNTTVTVPATLVQNNNIITVNGITSFNNMSLIDITISDGIAQINENAFKDMTRLKSVSLGNVSSIGNSAFKNCSNLSSIVLPSSITNIGNEVFEGCSNLDVIVAKNDLSNIQNLSLISGGNWYYQSNSSNASVIATTMLLAGLYSKYQNVSTTNEWEVKSYLNRNYIVGYLGNNQEITVPSLVVEADYSHIYEIFGLQSLKQNNFTSIIISEGIECLGVNVDSVDNFMYALISLNLYNDATGLVYFNPFYYYVDGVEYLCNNLATFVLPTSLHILGIQSMCNFKLLGVDTVLTLNGIDSAGENVLEGATVDIINFNVDNGSISAIPESAFKDCSAHTINIGYGPVLIMESAFENCSNLVNLSIPTSVLKFENSAFNNCSSLVSLDLKNITTMSSISGCSNLESITLRSNLSTPYATYNVYGKNGTTWYYDGTGSEVSYFNTAGTYYYNNTSFESLWTWELGVDGYYYITGYNGDATSIIIPSSVLDTDGVTSHDIYGIKSLNVNSGVLIKEVSISSGISVIGNNAFANHTNLANINLPTTITSIGSQAFSSTAVKTLILNCSSLTLSATALNGMSDLSIISVKQALNGSYTFEDGKTWKYLTSSGSTAASTMQNTGIYSCLSNVATTSEWQVTSSEPYYITAYLGTSSTLVVPKYVVDVSSFNIYNIEGIQSFYINNVVDTEITVEISDGIYYILDEAFNNCSKLSTITLPASIKYIGTNAFSNCSKLEEIIGLENTQIVSLGYDQSNSNNSSYNVFNGCSALKELHFPLSLTKINNKLFKDVANLSKIILESDVVEAVDLLTAGNGIWYYNADVIKTTIMKKSGTYLTSQIQTSGLWVLEQENGKYYIIGYLGGETDLVVPHEIYDEISGAVVKIFGVRNIGKTDLTSIIFMDGIEQIGESGALSNIFGGTCSQLTEIELSSTLSTIYSHALDNITSENIIITTTASQSLPYNLSGIKDVIWYYGNRTVEEISDIGSYSTMLIQAYMPDIATIESIVTCSTLQERNNLTISYGSINNAWFVQKYDYLNEWVLTGYLGTESTITTPTMIRDYFSVPNKCILRKINIFAGLNKDYMLHSVTKLIVSEGYTQFGTTNTELYQTYVILNTFDFDMDEDNLFSVYAPSVTGGVDTIKEVVLPTSLTKLGFGAFSNFSSLEKINFEDTNVVEIPAMAFSNTFNLVSLTFPETVKRILSFGLLESGVVNLELNEGLISADSLAFVAMNNLKSIVIPASLKSISTYAFTYSLYSEIQNLSQCGSLEKIIVKEDLSSSIDLSLSCNKYYYNGSQVATTSILKAGVYLNYICYTTNEWRVEKIDGKNYITEYLGNKLVVDVPAYVYDKTTSQLLEIYGVRYIHNDNIRKLTFREGIKSVGNGIKSLWNNYANNTLTYVALPSTLINNDEYILNNCNSIETIYLGANLSTSLVVEDICKIDWLYSQTTNYNNFLIAVGMVNGSTVDDEVEYLSVRGGYSNYRSFPESSETMASYGIYMASPSAGGYAITRYEGAEEIDIFVKAFGLYYSILLSNNIMGIDLEYCYYCVPVNSVASLRGISGVSWTEIIPVTEYNTDISVDNISFAEGITKIGANEDSNIGGFGGGMALNFAGQIASIQTVGSENTTDLLNIDNSFESATYSEWNKDGGTLSITNQGYEGKALSYQSSSASKAYLSVNVTEGTYVLEAMVKADSEGYPIQLQLYGDTYLSYSTYFSDYYSNVNNWQLVKVRINVLSNTTAYINLIKTALYDCLVFYKIDKGLPTTLTNLGSHAFALNNELSSINLSQTAIEDIEAFALAYTFTNLPEYQFSNINGVYANEKYVYDTILDMYKDGYTFNYSTNVLTIVEDEQTKQISMTSTGSVNTSTKYSNGTLANHYQDANFVYDEVTGIMYKDGNVYNIKFDSSTNILSYNGNNYYMRLEDDSYVYRQYVYDNNSKSLTTYDLNGNSKSVVLHNISASYSSGVVTITVDGVTGTLSRQIKTHTTGLIKKKTVVDYYYYTGIVNGVSFKYITDSGVVEQSDLDESTYSFDKNTGVLQYYDKKSSTNINMTLNAISSQVFASDILLTYMPDTRSVVLSDSSVEYLCTIEQSTLGDTPVYIVSRHISQSTTEQIVLYAMQSETFVGYYQKYDPTTATLTLGSTTTSINSWSYDYENNVLTFNTQTINMIGSNNGIYWGSGWKFYANSNIVISPTGVIYNNPYVLTNKLQLKKDLVIALPKTLTNLSYMALNTGATRYAGLSQSNLTSMAQGAFGQTYIVSNTISSSTTTTQSGYCENLIEINLPATFTEITFNAATEDLILLPSTAFSSAMAILSGSSSASSGYAIPVKYTGYTFAGNAGLENINIDPDNTVYRSVDGVMFNYSQTNLLAFPVGRTGTYELPYYVKVIDEAAFYLSSLTKLIVNTDLEEIGDYAFAGLIGYAFVSADGDYEDLAEYASNFTYIEGLEDSSLISIGRGAFSSTRISSLSLPTTLTTIGGNGDVFGSVFSVTPNLQSIELNSSLNNIYSLTNAGNGTWYYNFTQEVENLQQQGIYTTYKVDREWTVELINGKYWITEYNGEEKSITIPQKVININEIVDVYGVKSLNNNTITSITVADGIKEFGYSGVTNNILGSTSNDTLVSIELPSSIEYMTEQALNGLTSLTYLGLSNELATANSFAPTGKSQWYYYFGGTSSRTTTYKNSGIYTISEIQYANEEWVINEDDEIIAYIGSNTSITVPSHLLDRTTNKVIVVKGINSINGTGSNADIISSITKVIISEGLLSINDSDNGAFAGLTNVNTIQIASSLDYIGENAFADCVRLREITIPAGVQEIATTALPMDKNLHTITLEGSLDEIFDISTSYGSWFFNNEPTITSTIYQKGVYKKLRYTIVFDGNGGKTPGNQTYYEQTDLIQGQLVSFLTNMFTNSNKQFYGWALTKSTISGEYEDGQTFILPNEMSIEESDYTITLYAIWSQDIYIAYLDNNWDDITIGSKGIPAVNLAANAYVLYAVNNIKLSNDFVITGSFRLTTLSATTQICSLMSNSKGVSLSVNSSNKIVLSINNGTAYNITSTTSLTTGKDYAYFIYKNQDGIRLKVTHSNDYTEVMPASGTNIVIDDTLENINFTVSNPTFKFGGSETSVVLGTATVYESIEPVLQVRPHNTTNVKVVDKEGERLVSISNASSTTLDTLNLVRMIPSCYDFYLSTDVIPTLEGYNLVGYTSVFDYSYLTVSDGKLVADQKVNFEEDKRIIAKWEPFPYTMTYYANNGTSDTATQTVYCATNYTTYPSTTFTKEGYILTGWSIVANTTADYSCGQEVYYGVLANSSLYAVWEPVTYYVRYNKNNSLASGTMTNSTHIYDVVNSLTTNSFTYNCYIFQGWSRTSSGSVQYTNGQSVNNLSSTQGDIVDLYAVWTPITYTVNYYNGSTLLGSSSHSYDVSKALTSWSSLDGTVTNSSYGWSFYGWATNNSTYSKTYDNGQSVLNLSTTNNGSVDIYAVYLRTLTLYSGANKATNATYTQCWNPCGANSGTHYNAVTVSAPTAITNWIAEGWRTDTAASTNTYSTTSVNPSPTTTTSLYAVYSRQFTVNYNGNGATSGTTADTVLTIYLNTNSNTTSSQTITTAKSGYERTNYVFSNWGTTSSGGTTIDEETSFTNTVIAYNESTFGYTLYAQWVEGVTIRYTINYYNGSTNLGSSSHVCGVSKNLTLWSTLGGTVTNSSYGWSFYGWATDASSYEKIYTDGQSVLNLTSVDEDTINIYAVYSRTLTLHSGVNKATPATYSQFWNPYGIDQGTHYNTVTVDAPTAITNWTANGWRGDVTATTNTYPTTSISLGITDSTLTFYAVYSRMLTVSYNGNGATSGSTISTTPTIYLNTNSTTTSSQTITTASNGFTRSYYSFVNWGTTSSGGTTVSAGTSFTNNVAYDASTFGYTLYAQWTPFTYTVYYYNGSTSLGSSSHTYGVSKALTLWSTLGGSVTNSSYGWSFYGWAISSTTYEKTYSNGDTVLNLTETNNGAIYLYSVYQRTLTLYSGLKTTPQGTYTQNWNPYGSTLGTHYNYVTVAAPTAITYWTAIGWRTDTTAATYAYSPTSLTPTPTTGTTFYAVYSRTLTVSYDGNGATGGSTTSTTPTIYLNTNSETTSSQSITTATNGFTRTNYVFANWSTASSGGTAVSAGTTYSPSPFLYNSSTFGYTLYAQWSDHYTVYYYNGSTLLGNSIHYCGVAKTLTTWSTLGGTVANSSYGWYFYGWSKSFSSYSSISYSDGQSVTNISTTIALELYAVYARIIYAYSGVNSATSSTGTQYWNPYSTSYYSSVTVSATSISYWTHSGWRTDTSASSATYTTTTSISPSPSTNRYFYAVYTRTLKFTYSKSSTYKYGSALVNSTKTIYLNTYSTTTSSQSLSTRTKQFHTKVVGGTYQSYWSTGSTSVSCGSSYNPNFSYNSSSFTVSFTAA